MYNPYLPRTWAEPDRAEPERPVPPPRPSPSSGEDLAEGLLGLLPTGIAEKLRGLDGGDLLLLLLVLYLLWEDREDPVELLLALGLLLFL